MQDKETVAIFITYRNCDRKIMQPIRITSGPSTRTKKVKPVLPVSKVIPIEET